MNYFNDLRAAAKRNGMLAVIAAKTGKSHSAKIFARKAAHWGIEYLTTLGRWTNNPQLFHNERSRNAKNQNDTRAIG